MKEFRAKLRLKPTLWLGLTVSEVLIIRARFGSWPRLRFYELPFTAMPSRALIGKRILQRDTTDLKQLFQAGERYHVLVEEQRENRRCFIKTTVYEPEGY